MKYIFFFSMLLAQAALCFGQEHPDAVWKRQHVEKLREFVPSSAGENYDVKHYELDLHVDPNVYGIAGTVTTRFQMLDESPTIGFDLYRNMTIDSVCYNRQRVDDYDFSQDVIRIHLPEILQVGSEGTVSISYHGRPESNGFESFATEKHGNKGILWTLSEPYGAYTWWPCKQTLTDKADSIDVIVTVPNGNKVASNGLLMSVQPTDDTERFTRYHWKHKHPIATYLIAIAVTNYVELHSEVEVPDGQPISIVDYAYPEELESWQLNRIYTRKAMQFFNELFMLYPFADEKYGHARFPWGGGMEHQTMSFMFNLDETLVVHELAHQWFGNHITCGSWNDIWLNEGFATYCEDLYVERYYPNIFNAQRIIRKNSCTGLPGGSVYCYNTSDVNAIFNPRLSYDKGAMVLHMLRKQVGDDAFFNGIRSYLRDPALAGGFAETADLQRHIEAAADTSLVEFFDSWIYQQGYPSYRVAWQAGDTKTWVKISQIQSHPSAGFFKMHVPVQFTAAGKDTILWLHHTEDEQIFEVDPGFRPTAVSFDPNVEMISKNNTVVREDFVSLQAVPVPVRDDVRQILIYTPDGKQVGQTHFPGIETHIPLSSGVYVVKTVYRDQSVTTQKILIQQPQP